MNIKNYFGNILVDKNDSFLQIIIKNTIRTDHWHYSIGTPLLISRSGFDSLLNDEASNRDGREKRIAVKGLMKYSTDSYCPFDQTVNIMHNNIHIVKEGDKCFANTHVIKKVDYFDTKKFDSLINYIKEMGSITLDFGDAEGANGIVAALDLFKASFKHSSYISSRRLDTSQTKTFKIAVDFIDVSNVYPIFNSKKCDGIWTNVYIYNPMVPPGKNVLAYANLCSVYTNHKTNIFEVDGANLRGMEAISKSNLTYMVNDISKVVKSKTKSIQGAQRAPVNTNHRVHSANIDNSMTLINNYNRGPGSAKETELWNKLTEHQQSIIGEFFKYGVPDGIPNVSKMQFVKAVRDGLLKYGTRKSMKGNEFIRVSINKMEYQIEITGRDRGLPVGSKSSFSDKGLSKSKFVNLNKEK